MTVIAFKDGVMAADGAMFGGGLETPCPFPKIARAPDGSLWGMGGTKQDCWKLRQWVLAGCDIEAKPEFIAKDDEEIMILVARPDGTLWGACSRLELAPELGPCAYGAGSAATFCEGAMRAGASADEAVHLAIRYCQYAGGEVQAEHLP